MDDNGQRENGRHKADQYKSIHAQWMMPPQQMKDNHTLKLMAIIGERDKAIQDRTLALSEKKAVMAERDMVILQRDAAISERNSAITERDNALTALEYARENGNGGGPSPPPPHHMPKHLHHHHHLDASYGHHAREMHITDAYPISAVPESSAKARKPPRREKDEGKAKKASKKGKWKPEAGVSKGKVTGTKHQQEWKEQDLGLNQVSFDDSTMPVPVCSCTGKYQQCYKWGKGGWQSACCTTTLSMYPLPVMPNRRHARVGGRKMSGAVFTRLLSRLAADGHDLSTPLDLKDHWSKHGTNRYIIIK